MRTTRSGRWALLLALGILGAIGIANRPQISVADSGLIEPEVVDFELRRATLQHAVDLYTQEHDGLRPDAAQFARQVTGFTTRTGEFDPTSRRFGPYLISIPQGASGSQQVEPVGTPGAGWWYDQSTGRVSLPR